MNILTLLHSIRDAVHDNSATQTWCTTNYSRNHKVYVGVDTRKPPEEAEYPIVHIFPLAKSGGYELSQQDHIISVTCGIYDADTITVAGKANIVELEGVGHIEEFRKLVETAVVGADLNNLWVDSLNIEYETIEFFPFFLANMEFKIVHNYSQGDGAFD